MTSPANSELPDGSDAEPAPLLLRRARRLLDAVAAITNERGLTSGATAFDLRSAEDSLRAPLVAGGKVIGLLHADRGAMSARLTEFDRDLLGLFAEGLGFIFERTVCHEQMAALKRRLEEQARSVGDLIDGFPDADAPSPAMPAMPATAAAPARPFQLSGPLAELTRRELEVLSHLADGRSTAQIASTLFISPGTVTTHVKHLLHKLGTANRAEAVARYHRLRH